MKESRFVILAEGQFDPQHSKTANACIRYMPHRVAAVIDSTRSGHTAGDVLGFGGDIPVVATLEQGLARSASALLIGIAPQGGKLPDSWRAILEAAIDAGLEIWSGLHTFIGDDTALARRAASRGVRIHDLRRPPPGLEVATGLARQVQATVVLTVGTDCNIGKMTAGLQLRDALVASGVRVAFAATGQTGILLEGWGIAVDAVVADFIGGAAERLVLQAARDADIVLVEGQGSLVHPGFSGVTLGLVHGSVPHAMVMCAQPTRRTIYGNPWVRIPPLPEVIAMYEKVAEPLRPARVIAVALNTFDLPERAARAAIATAERETGLPATDPVRFDPAPIADAVLEFHRSRLVPTPV